MSKFTLLRKNTQSVAEDLSLCPLEILETADTRSSIADKAHLHGLNLGRVRVLVGA